MLAVGMLIAILLLVAGCSNNDKSVTPPADVKGNETSGTNTGTPTNSNSNAGDDVAEPDVNKPNNANPTDKNDVPVDTVPDDSDPTDATDGTSGNVPDKGAFTEPENVAVLVNKQYSLPEAYEPKDLVYPDVRFTFKEKIEKRMMRKEAAGALEKMFAGAEKDGIYLAGVSAYRSHTTQTSLFNRYVKKDGEEKAKTYSAVPGHSEHETGLAIDVSGSDGKCAAEDCFGGTKEAEWLAAHAHEYGYIIRYPKGQDSITGYKYEPWHLRYVGEDISRDIQSRNITLEEYYDAIPVLKNTK